MTNLIYRNHCLMTDVKDLEHLHTFEKFPMYMGCTDQAIEKDLLIDMSWWISKSSGSLQLNPLIPLDLLYAESHNENIGGTWMRHHTAFADFVLSCGVNEGFEFGGAHGSLAKIVTEKNSQIKWTLLDPNPTYLNLPNVKILKGFFDENFTFSIRPKAVIHSHLLEHLYEPKKFFNKLADSLDVNSDQIFSIPNLTYLLENKYTNALNFEHTFYLTQNVLEFLLQQSGFEIVKVFNFENHSLFYHTKLTKKEFPKIAFSFYKEHKTIFENFKNYNSKEVEKINLHIQKHSGDVFLFGAHIFSQFLFAFGLDKHKINSILDNSLKKQNRRLYGTPFVVRSPSILKVANKPAVILKAAAYNNEIKEDILRNIRTDVEFWE